MELSLNELRNTVGEARLYFTNENQEFLPTILRNHAQCIHEDLGFLDRHKTNFREKEAKITELIFEARRLKRELERKAFELEGAAKRGEPAVANTAHSAPSVKLPRVQLPTFSGESADDFRGFMEAFKDSLLADPLLTPVRKWLLLKPQLTGRACDLIKHFPTAPESYDAAIRILEDCYGSTRRAVLSLYQRLQSLPSATMVTSSLRMTYSQLEGILLSLQMLGADIEENFLRAVVLGKYPNELIHQLKITDSTTLAEFRLEVNTYIGQRDCTVQTMGIAQETGRGAINEVGSNGGAEGNQSKKPRHDKAISTNGGSNGTPAPASQVTETKTNKRIRRLESKRSCIFCSGDHWSDECTQVRSLDERLKLAKDKCHRCLRPKHEGHDTCRSWRTCFYCRESAHHSSLCPKQQAKILLSVENEREGPTSRFVTAVLSVVDATRTKSAEVRAILDTAGSRSLITARLAAELELGARGGKRVRLVGVNQVPLNDEPSTARRLVLCPPGARAIEIDVFVVPTIVSGVTSTSVADVEERYPRYASLPMPSEGNGSEVGLLLGYRALTAVFTLQKSVYVAPSLQLLSTKFGWIPFGSLSDEDEERLDSSVVALIREEEPLKMMSDLELVGLADFMKSVDEEEAEALEKFYRSIKRQDGRYEVAWPYRHDNLEIEDNFGLAFGCLNSLYRQLNRNQALLQAYDKLIGDQLESGIVEPINLRATPRGRLVHYLPHRAIIRLEKSTPLRMVFDAAAQNGKLAACLNDLIYILKGSNWVNDLPGVLLRFRRFGVAVSTDIVKAFHQIAITPSDRDVVRFLWLRDISKLPSRENLRVYRFKRMAFGVIASPFLLSATIHHHFRQYLTRYDSVIENDLYTDNLIASLPRLTDSASFYRVIKEGFGDMRMQLSQWASDDSATHELFAPEERVTGDVVGVLGLEWQLSSKRLRIRHPRLKGEHSPPTKRSVLREMASVFDPLGWAALIVLLAKLFIRRVWSEDYGWDQELRPALAEEWNELREELNRVAGIVLDRPYGFGGLEGARRIELHAFSDASAVAYGVVVYMSVHEERGCWTGIVACKNRLAAKKKISIPRLELLAAVTAMRYLVFVERALKLENTTKYLWIDAQCVLSWISSNKILPVFVEKSVKSIKSAGIAEFRYVPTSESPADSVSRGASFGELSAARWWNGPSWLGDSAAWPPAKDVGAGSTELKEIEEEISTEEAKILFVHSTIKLRREANPAINDGSPFHLNSNDFRSIGALVRRTAYCMRFCNRLLHREEDSVVPRLDYRGAKIQWIRWDQKRTYKQSVNHETNVSYLKNLKATTDVDGIIRCDTRLVRANLACDTRDPILLVKKSALTRLIILSIHSDNFHAGTAHTLAVLRKRYWLPHGRREVYLTIKNNCFTCRRSSAVPFKAPPMSPLPLYRIEPRDTPFSNVGVDVFGPFKVRGNSETDSLVRKKWVIIFTCLVVRAVHLEILESMTAEEFLLTFCRFVGRREVPRVVVSDNDPQFHVVDRVFQCVWRRFATADTSELYFAQHGIKWSFIPPHAPWMGGGPTSA